ncbi:hypothetical protein A2154_04540 [Candidatus Gottesmanbacteria bacterium RBG_16_43_7]|uniref:Nudix hydrolase domain-containing protein n=1 Tax=Candidatus Gottesmanbacteria bacterium RBG_16_43_7 TaxID=1798373 RepID=A0A1F5ZBL0_9BACT|nr:MAG: hypothetical protein A2154_04540 [Candidatus Gottesmanbacteria bacterium RBG_16_43_7]
MIKWSVTTLHFLLYNIIVIISAEYQYKFCPSCANPLHKKLINGKKRLTCNKCGFVFWNNPKPTTSVILNKDGKVLMLKRLYDPFKNYWVLPGGYIEYEENPEIAITREAKEETGLDITIDGVVYTYLIDTDPRGNSIDIVFRGIISAGKIKLLEHNQFRFFSPDKLPHLIAYKHREAINIWRKNNA